MTKTKTGIAFPVPKGNQHPGLAPQDPHRWAVPRVAPRTKAGAKGR
jgi:hypothetical protein